MNRPPWWGCSGHPPHDRAITAVGVIVHGVWLHDVRFRAARLRGVHAHSTRVQTYGSWCHNIDYIDLMNCQMGFICKNT